MSLIYVTGNAGAGKSTVCKELKARGYDQVHDIDENDISAWYDRATGKRVEYPKKDEQRTKAWNDNHSYKMARSRIEQFTKASKTKTIYLCGQSIHDEEVWDLFDSTIFLVVDKENLKYRLATREGNVFGKTPGEIDAIMEVHEPFQRKHQKNGALLIDATREISKVVDEIIRLS